ncbi:MAG: glycogen synthase GlgA, partial [Gallionellaceae bacterium]|nr:glycogen synthase GlgA [Gallionellaceae bacterium]
MRILFATSEIAPLVKTGGLADVSAALPAALRRIGADVRVLLPAYPQALRLLKNLREVTTFSLPNFPPTRLLETVLPDGVPLWLVDCPDLYQRDGGPYQDAEGRDWSDNAQRFGLLSKVAAVLGCAESPLDWQPDVVHCNDWQTGLTPAYLRFAERPAPCVMTIHNLAFQGVFPAFMTERLGLPWESFHMDGAEYYGNLSFLKAGLYYADRITTVSPTYAEEIQTKMLGFGMEGLLTHRREALSGIVNGIDYEEWNSATDPALPVGYDRDNLAGKRACKLELQRRMGLREEADVPLFGLVSRFTYQKGVDLVLDIAPRLLELPAQLVLLGSGDAAMQQAAQALAERHPGRVGVRVGFDEPLSRLIEAGADVFLMPSRFEPCGLNQMYSQHYGTPPIVRATGGLKDTVTDCNEKTLKQGSATGFVFDVADADSLMEAVQRAVAAYRDEKTWRALQRNGMAQDF